MNATQSLIFYVEILDSIGCTHFIPRLVIRRYVTRCRMDASRLDKFCPRQFIEITVTLDFTRDVVCPGKYDIASLYESEMSVGYFKLTIFEAHAKIARRCTKF